MSNENKTLNILLCGIGGQGVILASTVISESAVKAGYDIKKSEVHGMSQRGGAVTSHIRYGKKVYSPLIPVGEADYLISFNPQETKRNKHMVKDDGKILEAPQELIDKLDDIRSLNICTIGILSNYLDIDTEIWKSTIKETVSAKIVDLNLKAFDIGLQFGGD